MLCASTPNVTTPMTEPARRPAMALLIFFSSSFPSEMGLILLVVARVAAGCSSDDAVAKTRRFTRVSCREGGLQVGRIAPRTMTIALRFSRTANAGLRSPEQLSKKHQITVQISLRKLIFIIRPLQGSRVGRVKSIAKNSPMLIRPCLVSAWRICFRHGVRNLPGESMRRRASASVYAPDRPQRGRITS